MDWKRPWKWWGKQPPAQEKASSPGITPEQVREHFATQFHWEPNKTGHPSLTAYALKEETLRNHFRDEASLNLAKKIVAEELFLVPEHSHTLGEPAYYACVPPPQGQHSTPFELQASPLAAAICQSADYQRREEAFTAARIKEMKAREDDGGKAEGKSV